MQHCRKVCKREKIKDHGEYVGRENPGSGWFHFLNFRWRRVHCFFTNCASRSEKMRSASDSTPHSFAEVRNMIGPSNSAKSSADRRQIQNFAHSKQGERTGKAEPSRPAPSPKCRPRARACAIPTTATAWHIIRCCMRMTSSTTERLPRCRIPMIISTFITITIIHTTGTISILGRVLDRRRGGDGKRRVDIAERPGLGRVSSILPIPF